MALTVTVSGGGAIDQGAQRMLAAVVTDAGGNTLTSGLMYVWTASRGSFIGDTSGAQVTYQADFTDADTVNVTITCAVTRAADTMPTISAASLTALSDIGVTGIVLNLFLTALGAINANSNNILYNEGITGTLDANSDDDLSSTLHIVRVRWNNSANAIIINSSGTGNLGDFFSGNTTQSLFIVFPDGTYAEFSSTDFMFMGSTFAGWNVTDTAVRAKFDALTTTSDLTVGVATTGSIGLDADSGSGTAAVTAAPVLEHGSFFGLRALAEAERATASLPLVVPDADDATEAIARRETADDFADRIVNALRVLTGMEAFSDAQEQSGREAIKALGYQMVFGRDTDGDISSAALVTAASNIDPRGIAYDGTRLRIVDTQNDAVWGFSLTGARDTDGDISQSVLRSAASNIDPRGITYDGTRLRVTDQTNDAVWGFSLAGARDTDGDISQSVLRSAHANIIPQGITYDGTRLRVLDSANDAVWGFSLDGQRDVAGDISQSVLRNANSTIVPVGITFDGTRLLISDSNVDSIWGFSLAGARDTDGDISHTILRRATSIINPQGIAYDGTRLRVLDPANDAVWGFGERQYLPTSIIDVFNNRISAGAFAGNGMFIEADLILVENQNQQLVSVRTGSYTNGNQETSIGINFN